MTNPYDLNWLDSMAGLSQAFDVPPLSMREPTEFRLASVLVPLYWHHGQWHLLFIRRVVNERDRHSGQVAFPGGRRDPDDIDAVDTAMREAEEEIGLARSEIEVLATLDDYLTSSHYLVSPIIARVPWPYNYQAQPSEVDRIFSIPVLWLSNPSNLELRHRKLEREGQSVQATVVYFKPYDEEVLWGASARITIALLRAIYNGKLALPAVSA